MRWEFSGVYGDEESIWWWMMIMEGKPHIFTVVRFGFEWLEMKSSVVFCFLWLSQFINDVCEFNEMLFSFCLFVSIPLIL